MGGLIQVPYGHGTCSFIEPAGSPGAYKTYSARWPLVTHWRPATCEDVDCEAWLNGWKTVVPDASDHAELIRSADFRRRYRYTEQRAEGGLAEFTFPAGQACFQASQHKVQLARPATFLVTPGDFRARTGPARVHARAEDWVEDMSETLGKISEITERG